MWLRDMLLSLWRLWYVVLAGLLATAYVCYILNQTVPATYTARGSLVMMPPNSTVGPDGNPFLFLGGMSQALDILAVKVSSEEIAKPIVDSYPDTSYVAEPDRSTSGSVLLIRVASGNASDIMAVLESSVAAVPAVLTGMQDAQNIPPDSRLRLMTLVVDTEPKEETKTRTAAVMGAGGVGVALTVLLTGFVDGRMLARRLRKEIESPSGSRREASRSRRRVKDKAAGSEGATDVNLPESDPAAAAHAEVPSGDGTGPARDRTPAKSKA
ncbi:hypothetical protein [Arthrobacter sp. CDRTa11]|uniref:hypothetical protein n=1 Tax=Arthrobacter sp. CDRTa11 TaxID=2651199 RepID=UPI002265B036|nr:hypothetical protein [Arthrobacter sp. CDRTa11]